MLSISPVCISRYLKQLLQNWTDLTNPLPSEYLQLQHSSCSPTNLQVIGSFFIIHIQSIDKSKIPAISHWLGCHAVVVQAIIIPPKLLQCFEAFASDFSLHHSPPGSPCPPGCPHQCDSTPGPLYLQLPAPAEIFPWVSLQLTSSLILNLVQPSSLWGFFWPRCFHIPPLPPSAMGRILVPRPGMEPAPRCGGSFAVDVVAAGPPGKFPEFPDRVRVSRSVVSDSLRPYGP